MDDRVSRRPQGVDDHFVHVNGCDTLPARRVALPGRAKVAGD
jgi:hypothetical protein